MFQQKIAKKQEIAWKNIYSGIFRDLDEILLPMEIAEEDGRLPLKRGPKALQENLAFNHQYSLFRLIPPKIMVLHIRKTLPSQ